MRVRPATEADLDAMVEVMFAEPSVEQLAFMPSIAGARRFMRTIWSLAGIEEFIVADDAGDVVGFAWVSDHGASLRHGARAAVAGWGPLGPLRVVLKGWPRLLVELEMPPGPKLVELQTHPERRGTGVGTVLLNHIIEGARDRPLSLTTRTDNRARRLYERHGFELAGEKTHRAYARRTDAAGRILMIRPAAEAGGE